MQADHVVLLTRRLEELADAFEKLGFTLTPVGEHGATFGTANRCVTFADNYVEIIGIRADTQANAPLRAFLEHAAAVSMISMLSTDIDATFADLQRRGVIAQPPLNLSRDMGDSGHAEFSVVTPMPGPETEVPPFFTMRKAVGGMFAPRWRAHANGATRLAAVDVEVRNPQAAASAYERVGGTVIADGERRSVVQGDPTVALSPIGSLKIGPRGDSPQRTSMLTMAVSDLAATRKVLTERKVQFREIDGAVLTDLPGERRCVVRFIAA